MFRFFQEYSKDNYGPLAEFYNSKESALRAMNQWGAPEHPYIFVLLEYSQFSDGTKGNTRLVDTFVHNVDGSFYNPLLV